MCLKNEDAWAFCAQFLIGYAKIILYKKDTLAKELLIIEKLESAKEYTTQSEMIG